MLKTEIVNATTLSDAWYQTLYKCVEQGRDFNIDRGSYEGQKRLEFDWITINIKNPSGELLPQVNPALNFPNPVADNYLDDYMPYLMTGEEKEGESYTYGQRICMAELPLWAQDPESYKNILIQNNPDKDFSVWDNRLIFPEKMGRVYLNQMELMIATYKSFGYRNNQMVLQVGSPYDMVLQDPPCLRHIDTRIQDGALHFLPYFRSWDLFGGFPANLAAIELMKQYCAEAIGVENGSIIASSKGLHLYDYVWEIVEAIRGRTINEFREEARLKKIN